MESYQKITLPSSSSGIFYGNWIVVVAFFQVFVFAGCGVGAFSIFVKSLQAEFNWGRGQIMTGFSIFYLLTGLAAPVIGGLVDRYGVRGVVSVGSGFAGMGLASLFMTKNIYHFYAAYTVIGIGMAAVGQVPSSAAVSNWFVKRRGTAIGIMSTGIGVGILVVSPFIGAFVMPRFGWRASYLALALITWMLLPLSLFVLRTRPADMGLYPDGSKTPLDEPETNLAAIDSSGLSLRAALGTSAFWLLAVTFFINGLSALGVIQNLFPYLQDNGFPGELAAAALTFIGLGSAIGKFAFGWLCDQIKAKHASAISFGFLAAGTMMLLYINSTTRMPITWLCSILLGLGAGGWLPTMSMLTNTYFGLKSYGIIFGMISLIQGIGGGIGPMFAGYMYDIMDTYRVAFLVFLGTFAVAIFTVSATRKPETKLIEASPQTDQLR